MAHVFVALDREKPYEKASLYNRSGSAVRQVLWGDWLEVAEPQDIPQGSQNSDTWLWVRWAWSHPDPAKRMVYKIKRKFTQSARPLEIIFVDVGIGDGAVLITPERDTGTDAVNLAREERVIVIDAGKNKAMREFLDGRFKAYRKGFDFHAAIITHSDLDHYGGFSSLVSNKKITFRHLYHNGIAELSSAEDWSRVGGVRNAPASNVDYVDKLVVTDAQARATFDPALGRTNKYARIFASGIEKGNLGDFSMLGVNIGAKENPPGAERDHYWVPGFAPSAGREYTIEVLGPWVEYPFGPGDPALRVFEDSLSHTKNGHSVLLRLAFGNFSVLFGGDLNRASERFLLQKYAGIEAWPEGDAAARNEMIGKASKALSSDVMKTCHHGASDVTDEFLMAVNPAAFVISSGDQDANYVHPRPDLLGRLGRAGRGDAPVLLSTELQRSTRDIDNSKLVARLTREIKELTACDAAAHTAAGFEESRAEELAGLLEDFADLALPSVAVDGAIYVKTDGDLLIAAFKKETQDPKSKWFYYAYRLTAEGTLELIPHPD